MMTYLKARIAKGLLLYEWAAAKGTVPFLAATRGFAGAAKLVDLGGARRRSERM
jgi:hypothetical protein